MECVKLTSDKLYEDNSLELPDNIVPFKAAFSADGPMMSATVEPYCFTIFVVDRQ